MGASAIKNQLYSYIECDKPDQLIILLKAHPKYINQQINSSSHHTPLLRAVWKSNYTIVNILLGEFAADVNLFGGKYTPLMLAAIRGNMNIIDLLLYFKADVLKINKDGMNSIDLAILFGQYQAALKISSAFQESQSGQIISHGYKKVWQSFENRHKKLKLPFQINYKEMIQCLNQRVQPIEASKIIFKNSFQNKDKNGIQKKNSRNQVFQKQQQNLKNGIFLKNKIKKIESGTSVDTKNTIQNKNNQINKQNKKHQLDKNLNKNNNLQNDMNKVNLTVFLNETINSQYSTGYQDRLYDFEQNTTI